jgi:hypothetical protein
MVTRTRVASSWGTEQVELHHRGGAGLTRALPRAVASKVARRALSRAVVSNLQPIAQQIRHDASKWRVAEAQHEQLANHPLPAPRPNATRA